MDLREELLKTRKVAVWGMGYLGYTFLLRLQAYGFTARVVDLNGDNIRRLNSNEYPTKSQIKSWSRSKNIPSLNKDLLEPIEKPGWMFDSHCRVHCICVPPNYRKDEYNKNLHFLASIFREQLGDEKILVVFQSVSGPGSLKRDFVEQLGEPAPNVTVATAFRSDWSLEEFFADTDSQWISADEESGYEQVESFYSLLGIETRRAGTVREAELLENSRNALEFTIKAFFNQLSLSYPAESMQKLAPRILEGARMDGCTPGFATGGFRMPTAIDNLLRETPHQDHMSLIRESGSAHLGWLFELVDYLVRSKIEKVMLLGFLVQGEIALSPALFLAESLVKNGIKVYVHDPEETRVKLESLVKGAEFIEFPSELPKLDALLILNNALPYSQLPQNYACEQLDGKVKLIIDASGAFQELEFVQSSYFHVGDGNLDLLG